MYKIWNYLFGWDYILWNNSAASGIARIFVSWEGEIFYWRYKIINVVDIVKVSSQVHWLTCHPSKYFKDKSIVEKAEDILKET